MIEAVIPMSLLFIYFKHAIKNCTGLCGLAFGGAMLQIVLGMSLGYILGHIISKKSKRFNRIWEHWQLWIVSLFTLFLPYFFIVFSNLRGL